MGNRVEGGSDFAEPEKETLGKEKKGGEKGRRRRSLDGSERGEEEDERESFVEGNRVEGGSDFADPKKKKKAKTKKGIEV